MRRAVPVSILLLLLAAAFPVGSASASAPFAIASTACAQLTEALPSTCAVGAEGVLRWLSCAGLTCSFELVGRAEGETTAEGGLSRVELFARMLLFNSSQGFGYSEEFPACARTEIATSVACSGHASWATDLYTGRCEDVWIVAEYANVPARLQDPVYGTELGYSLASSLAFTRYEACRTSVSQVVVRPYVAPPPPGPPTLHLSGSAPGSAVIVRFNVTADSDLRLSLSHRACPDADYSDLNYAHAIFRVRDGTFASSIVGLGGGGAFFVEESSVAVGAAGAYAQLPVGNPLHSVSEISGGCATMSSTATNTPGTDGIRSHVLIGATDAEVTSWHVFANYTQGVVSYDVATVPYHALTRDHFDEGVHATLRLPLLAGAGAGAALRHDIVPTRDLGGYWWPDYGELAEGGWCLRDGAACAPETRAFAAKPGTSYAFGYDQTVDTWGGGYVLQYFEFPDTSYLA